ncbi:MAG: hypothetical protein R3346_03690 [Candidatus Spechtbacterales bacterium]|nr:hypothetical protein [Candidatus Spechtbacterales bacterium]
MIKKLLLIGLPVLAVVVLIGFVITDGRNGNKQGADNTNNQQNQRTQKGIGLSPKSFNGADFRQFFSKASKGSSIILWGGTWESLGAENSAPRVVLELQEDYRHSSAIVVDVPSETLAAQVDLRPLLEDAAAFAEEYKPAYMGLGNEVNFYYDFSPEEYEFRMQFYRDAYDMIKEVSPDTQVFTVFQLESMKGMQGGLFGGENNPTRLSQWDLLEDAEVFDFIAFTSYPGLVYKHPDDIPQDYFRDILSHTDKPIAFSETGWFREGPDSEWESSVEEQERYIRKLPSLISPTNPKFVTWLFLYDQETRPPFTTMGLLAPEDETSDAWEAWQLIRL